MSIAKLLQAPLRYRLWRPYHLRLIIEDLTGTSRQPVQDDKVHLAAAIDWLCRAQDLRDAEADAGGVSAGWSFEDAWLPSYPETSGYIVESFFAAAKILGRDSLRERCQRILDWELSIQNPDGSFPGHFGEAGSRPVIFNTGQIIHGMVAGYQELHREECLEAAVRAGHWMVGSQDDDGCWRRNVHNDVPHTYNTRAAWALLRAGLIAGDAALARAAEKNIRWALTQQTPCGWFATNAFTEGVAPFTHTIAYAIRGIMESGFLLEDEAFLAAASKAALAIAGKQRDDGGLAGTYSDNWAPRADYCCLTGLAQMTIIWQRLSRSGAVPGLDGMIQKALRYLKANHRVVGDGSPADGGMAGSAPIWGRYSMFEYPNWAAKFFADALMANMADIVIPPAAASAVT